MQAASKDHPKGNCSLLGHGDLRVLLNERKACEAVQSGQGVLNQGAKVSYEEKDNRGRTSGENLRVGERVVAVIEPADFLHAGGF
jgi:hypothetical protein